MGDGLYFDTRFVKLRFEVLGNILLSLNNEDIEGLFSTNLFYKQFIKPATNLNQLLQNLSQRVTWHRSCKPKTKKVPQLTWHSLQVSSGIYQGFDQVHHAKLWPCWCLQTCLKLKSNTKLKTKIEIIAFAICSLFIKTAQKELHLHSVTLQCPTFSFNSPRIMYCYWKCSSYLFLNLLSIKLNCQWIWSKFLRMSFYCISRSINYFNVRNFRDQKISRVRPFAKFRVF